MTYIGFNAYNPVSIMIILFFLSKTSKNPKFSFTALVILNKLNTENFLDRAQAFLNQAEPHWSIC